MLKQQYQKEIKPRLMEKFGYKNPHQAPQLVKIIINASTANHAKDKQLHESVLRDMTALAGQKPVPTRAKKSISNFKLREGQVLGWMVTLRGERMYDFIERFTTLTAPRIQDFRGFNKPKGGAGCCTIGIKDQSVFPEVDLDKIQCTQGMGITFVTSAKNDEECFSLLTELGIPFKN